MKSKIALKILAISIALLMVVSCAMPSIAVDNHSRKNTSNQFDDAFSSENITATNTPFPSSSNTIYVPDNYSKIQWAVDNASAGDMIIVRDGTYTENVDADKPHLTIRSENGSDKTIVQAANTSDNVLEITSDYVNISGFTVTALYTTPSSFAVTIIVRDATYTENVNIPKPQSFTNVPKPQYLTIQYEKVTSDRSRFTVNIESEEGHAGICLGSGVNHCNISGNNVSNTGYGIHLVWDNNFNIIMDNTFSNNQIGIRLNFSSKNTITNNIISGREEYLARHSSIDLSNSNNNTISNNKCFSNYWAGISLGNSNNNTISDNTCFSNLWHGIFLGGSENNNISNNNASTSDSGIYLDDSNNNTISSNKCSHNWAGIDLWSSNNFNTISSNECSSASRGIYLTGENNFNTITRNNCSNNQAGILFEGANNNTISSNNCSNNSLAGISFLVSDNNTISNNNCQNNEVGIDLWYSNNTIYLNNFNNTDNVFSEDSTNIWNSTSKITYTYNGSTYINYLGNYWDDYTGPDDNKDGIGDTPYPIDSDEDNYPLMERFENYINQVPESPWPMVFHDPQHTGRSQYAGPQTNDTKLVFPLQGLINHGAIIGSDGTIYIGIGPSGTWTTNIYAITENGSLKWNSTIGSNPNTNAAPYAIASDGTIYVKRSINCCPPASGYILYALHPNGTIKWFFNQSKFIDITYFSNATHWHAESLYVEDVNIDQTGSIYFTAMKRSSTYLKPNHTCIESNYTYYLFSLNPNGTFKWMYTFPSSISSLSPIAIGHNGNIYITPMNRSANRPHLIAFAPNGSIVLWTEPLQGSWLGSPSIGADGTIYINGPELTALAPNGTMLWERDVIGAYAVGSTPIITNDSVIVITSHVGGGWWGAIQAFDFDGNTRWIFNFEKDTSSRQPIADGDGNVYFGAIQSEKGIRATYALNSNGTLKWAYNRSFISYAIGFNNTLYALAYEGLFAFFPENEPENHPPNPPTNLLQFKSDSATVILVGGTTDERKVYFKGTVSDPDGDQVKLQVELRRLDEYGGQFDETKGGLKDSILVENGSEAVAYAYGLIDADYHWRARTVDEHGEPSEWQDFGNNDISEADFTVKVNILPTANAGGPYYGETNELIQFNGSGTDPDGDAIIAYIWDFDNDGETDSTLQNSTHSWSVAGTYYPALKVQDGKGAWSEWNWCTVNVYDPSPHLGPYPLSLYDKYYVRIFNIDDTGKAYVNGKLVASVNFGQDNLVGITGDLHLGENEINLTVKNLGEGYTYGFEIIHDDGTLGACKMIWHDSCGEVGVYGCNDNEQTGENIVYDKKIILELEERGFSDFTFVQLTDVHIGYDPEKEIRLLEICSQAGILPALECMKYSKVRVEERKKEYEESYERFTATLNSISSLDPKPAFILVTGDHVEWNDEKFFMGFKSAISSFTEQNNIPFYFIPGNHDRRESNPLFDDDLKNYHEYIKTPLYQHPDFRNINEDNYLIEPDNFIFEWGNYIFIGLDSGKDDFDGTLKDLLEIMKREESPKGTGLTDEQMNKLRSLEHAKRKIIFMHHPAINYKGDGCIASNREGFIKYCKEPENNVELVLTGHTHQDAVYDANGKYRIWNWGSILLDERPLFIQTRSATKPSLGLYPCPPGYRIITVDKKAIPHVSTTPPEFVPVIKAATTGPVNLHAYNSKGEHTGFGSVDVNIPESFYTGNYNGTAPSLPQIIILYNISDDYLFKVTPNLESSNLTKQTLSSEENDSFNLTIEKQTDDSSTLISYQNISITQNTTANVSINQTTTNYTMEIDTNGDGEVDETKSPDSIETNYAPNAAIISPENNSTSVHRDEITFNGTGTDPEDGVLTNASLVWTSDINGIIGVGNKFNTSNLSAGTHTITLMVNDSADLIDTESIEILINAPDLTLNSSDISFSNPNPTEGEIIAINATIHNIGLINATNVTVQFFDGIPEFQISNVTINAIRTGENETLNVTWNTTGKMGNHSISVMIDPDNLIEEMNETNNRASRFIVVKKNEPPIASFIYSPENPVVDQTITFNASNSTDSGGFITNYEWDFGDGNITNLTKDVIVHSYFSEGVYRITLTVKDEDGATNSTTRVVNVSLIKFNISLSKGWNLISVPLNLTSWKLGNESEVGNPLNVTPKNSLSSIYRYNTTSGLFEKCDHFDDWGWWQATGSESFTELEPGRGYWVMAKNDCFLTFTGTEPSDLNIGLDAGWNLIGWYSVEEVLLGEEAIVENPLNVTPKNSLTSIYRYNSYTGLFEKCDHFDDWGWWQATGSESFTELEPGRGYWVMAKNNCVWRHET